MDPSLFIHNIGIHPYLFTIGPINLFTHRVGPKGAMILVRKDITNVFIWFAAIVIVVNAHIARARNETSLVGD